VHPSASTYFRNRIHSIVPVGEDVPGGSRTCGWETNCVSVRHCVMNAKAIRPMQRSLRITRGNTASMGFNRGLYRGMKRSSTNRQNRQKLGRNRNGEMSCGSAEERSQVSGEKSSIIRQSECCCCLGLAFDFRSYIHRAPSPRIPIYAPTVLSEQSLVEEKGNNPTPLCFIPIATFQKRWRCDFGRRWPCLN